MKKNVLTLAAIGVVAALGLTACTSADEATPSPSATLAETGADTAAADAAALESVTWTDGEDMPALEFEAPLSVGDIAVRSIAEGDGDVIEEGSYALLDFVIYDGGTGEQIDSTYTAGAPQALQVAEGSIAPAFYEALLGSQVGAQIVYAAPGTSTDPTAATLIAVTVSSVATALERADGTPVTPADGLPTVTLGEDGAPSIDMSTAGEEPTELVVQPLMEGDGATVSAESQVVVHYTGWLWDGTQFDSSWDRGMSTSFPLTGVIPGWTQGLAGQQVGSQVLLIVPSDLGYGDEGSGDTIPGGATLVFVVDILAAF